MVTLVVTPSDSVCVKKLDLGLRDKYTTLSGPSTTLVQSLSDDS